MGRFTYNLGLAVLAVSSAFVQTAASELVTRQNDCQDVHIFLAKGNNETEPGRQAKLVDAICSGLDSCDYEDIHFDNRYETVFCRSLEEGARNGKTQLTDYAERCPDSKLVVSGYSQGAHVVGDILGGGGGTFFQGCQQAPNEPLDPETSPGNKIVAALLIGDTRHTADQSYNALSGAAGNGLFPRNGSQLADLNEYSGVLQSFCVATDPICAADLGPEEVETHLNYFDISSNVFGEWVQNMVADSNSTSTNSTTSSSTGSSTSSSSSTSSTSSSSFTTESTSATSTTSESSDSSEAPVSETGAAASATSSTDSDNSAAMVHIESAVVAIAALVALMNI
ncbi:uncharacterized protein HMPREF1541_09559 [Cyphellophora europaea CBS 101466]|uniref:Cutinase n=1 Tax=Cyphellophora europaea (strain CBS 101466) TaxID=1220924 RepID=W2SAG6_CYPE1|nr:uncharacterized protein HMPREF1541_09559 [Cyphellophora europaea CBS 101466]ETN45726.1 hypothetical protein HMPREF1541_09559 [Cyphellophora europaea CBS 101466]